MRFLLLVLLSGCVPLTPPLSLPPRQQVAYADCWRRDYFCDEHGRALHRHCWLVFPDGERGDPFVVDWK